MKDKKILKAGLRCMVTLPVDIVRSFGWDGNIWIR